MSRWVSVRASREKIVAIFPHTREMTVVVTDGLCVRLQMACECGQGRERVWDMCGLLLLSGAFLTTVRLSFPPRGSSSLSHPQSLHRFPWQPAIFLPNEQWIGKREREWRWGVSRGLGPAAFPFSHIMEVSIRLLRPNMAPPPLFRDDYISLIWFFFLISHLASPIASHFTVGKEIL